MRAMRFFTLLVTMLLTAGTARGEDDKIRFGFFPPLGEDIAYSVEYRHDQDFGGRKQAVHWTHEVFFRMDRAEAGNTHSGTFSIRAVSDREGAANDLAYLIARAVEGETYAVKTMHGVPIEVDWPSIKARVETRLPQLAGREMAAMILPVLPVFGPDGVNAVLRPFWATGPGYLWSFNRDNSISTEEGLDLPSWFQVPGSTLSTYGGRAEDTDDLMLVWRLEPTRDQAARKLGPELKGLATSIAGSVPRAEVEARLAGALAGGIEAIEGGVAIFDLTPGIMRSFQLNTRLVAGDLRREAEITITRLKPE